MPEEQKARIEKSITLGACSAVILMPFLGVYYGYQQGKSTPENSKNIIDKTMISSLLLGALLGAFYATKDGICKTVSDFFTSKPTENKQDIDQQLKL